MTEFLVRFEKLVGKENIDNICSKHIIVFGVGGVGGAVCEMLVRSGVRYLDIVDFDEVDVTNINRQVIAFSDNVGVKKVYATRDYLLKINPECEVNIFDLRFNEENARIFDFSRYDMVVDCIDDVKNKKLLIKTVFDRGAPIISSMGAGNRYGIPHFEVCDIYQTSVDPLAKIMRKFCKENGITHLDVVYTRQEAQKVDSGVGSVVYYPMNMATIICAYIINKFLKGESNGNIK